jgi:hypothetical protein
MRTGKEPTMKRELTELLQKGYQVEKEFIATLSDEERNADGTLKIGQPRICIAHNAYWRKHHAEDVLAVLTGKTPTHIDDANQ